MKTGFVKDSLISELEEALMTDLLYEALSAIYHFETSISYSSYLFYIHYKF